MRELSYLAFTRHYTVDATLEVGIVEEARRKSVAIGAYLDRKSLRSADRQKISEALEVIGLPALREGEIRELYPLDI